MVRSSVFQTIPKENWIHEGKHFFMLWDNYPVSPGHILIISKELRNDFFELTTDEALELPLLIQKAKAIVESTHAPDGYNIGMNCGAAAGQTVFHFHCHVIPRYAGDTPSPRGGVRNSIPGKGDY